MTGTGDVVDSRFGAAPMENEVGMFAQRANSFDPALVTEELELTTVRNLVTEVECRVHPDPRPVAVRTTNLRTLTTLLDEAGIPHFVVPAFNDRGTAIAVSEDHRGKVSKAILGASPRPLVTQVAPKPPVLRSSVDPQSTQGRQALAGASVLKTWWPLTDSTRSIVFGPSYAVDLEFWKTDTWREGVYTHSEMDDAARQNRLVAPRANRVARVVEAGRTRVTDDLGTLSRLTGGVALGVPVVAHPDLVQPTPDQVTFPIDVVYTWVDGTDAEWRRRRDAASGADGHREAASDARFMSRDELRYSLRSLYANAPWVNNVFIVTDGQRPRWLVDAPGVTVVDHREIFRDPTMLPVFNSHAIEANIHRIPGLSEHFVYFNDDMFIGRPVTPNVFFHPNGIAKHFPSQSRVPFSQDSTWDTPVDAATKNVRRLMLQTFGVAISQVMEHAPYALRRSVLEEMEERFPEDFAVTSASKTRSPGDLNIASNFAHHFGFQVGKAVPATMSFAYAGVSARDLKARLDRLLARRDRDAFCLNDSFSEPEDVEAQLAVITPFLEAYFPVASPWEK